jgi:sugar phosphate isomerase/epimerase
VNQNLALSTFTRRQVLAAAAATGVAHALPPYTSAQTTEPKPSRKIEISLFSKILQWTDIKEAAAIAKDLGFDAMDLTVRPKGHVLPERVETDLPQAVETVRRAGLHVSMISTEIASIASPYAEAMLKTASALGIRHYRWGGLTYKGSRSIPEQLDALKPQVRSLAALNQKHRICGMYHTHSGPNMIGGPVWDLWLLLQDLDPQWIGMNYDIGHATVEGGYGGWETSAQLAKDSMRGIALKDFRWPAAKPGVKAGSGPKQYEPEWCPIGEGIVDFREFFSIATANGFSGPVQMHFEYTSLGGAENGGKTLRLPKPQLIAALRKDIDYVRGVLRELNLA